MKWIIESISNFPVILCGIFYSVLCIFSIVTGLIYASGKKKLNPLELSDKFMSKLSDDEMLKKFTIKMGWVTFIVRIVQGITAFALFKGYSIILYVIAIGFTIFSICSVLCQYELASIAVPDLCALRAQFTIQIRAHPKAERFNSVGA